MDVLEAQPRLETGRRVALLGDNPSIGFVYRRSEQRVGENVEISRSVDSGLAHKGEGLAESFDHCGNQEIAAEFDEVRLRGLVGDDEGVLTKGPEQGLARLHGFRLTGGHDKKLARRSGLRAAEHRCRHEAMLRSRMRAREPLGERDADRAHGDMNRESLKPGEDAVRAEYHAFDRSIVGEHGDDHVAARSLPWRLGEPNAFSDERLGLGRRAVIDGKGVFGLEQIGGHAAAHAAKPDESNLHDLQLLMTLHLILWRAGLGEGWLPLSVPFLSA